MKEILHTGGLKQFEITDEHRKKLESEDTEYTTDFKQGYKEHLRKKKVRQKYKRIFLYSGLGLTVVGLIFSRSYNTKATLGLGLLFIAISFMIKS